MTLAFDTQQIYYSDIPSVGNPLLPNLVQAPLGAGNGAGFGWDDMTIYKLGLEIDGGGPWVWRFGASHGNQPIPSARCCSTSWPRASSSSTTPSASAASSPAAAR